MNTTTTTAEILAELDQQDVAARATECSVTGCDRTFHTGDEKPNGWHHRIAALDDDVIGGDVIVDPEGETYGYVYPAFDDETFAYLDGDAARALATKLEAVPAKLRQLADQIDARNRNA